MRHRVSYWTRRGAHPPPGLVLGLLLAGASDSVNAAVDSMIYEDAPTVGWSDYSWNTTSSVDTVNKQTGASSLVVTYKAAWAALSLRSDAPIATASYGSIRFWIYGRPGSGTLSLTAWETATGPASTPFQFTPTANAWTEVDVPLSALGNPTAITRLDFQDKTGTVQPAYRLDTLRLIGKPLPQVTLSINAAAGRKPISLFIYGINGFGMSADEVTYLKSLGLSVRRWGGNHTSRYNWQLDASSHGRNWYFENVKQIRDSLPPADSAVTRMIGQNRSAAADTVLTVPMIGYVAKDDTSCGFSIAKYGPQQASDTVWRPDCGNGISTNGTPITGNALSDTSLPADSSFATSWVNYLVTRYGKAGGGGIRFYGLDNEPDIWWGNHRDVAPVGLTYDQLRDRSYQYAAAIKAVDPAAQILGPVIHGWTNYWYSAYDAQRQDWTSPDDQLAHGSIPLVPWYLQQMKAYEQANGKRLLDYLDLHYYPSANGVSLSSAGSAAVQALRLRTTRSLWDPTYVDESWIRDAGPDSGIVKLIPRMRSWVSTNYPGTKAAISEYNWGALDHINGALAQADVLGIFGREGLHLATLWGAPKPDQPGAFAFRMYRNYNGTGGRFGETSVSATSSDQSRLAVYAAEEKATGALTLMVINKSTEDQTAPLTFKNFTPSGTLQRWRYSAANLSQIVRIGDGTFTGTQFTGWFPASSITLYRLPKVVP